MNQKGIAPLVIVAIIIVVAVVIVGIYVAMRGEDGEEPGENQFTLTVSVNPSGAGTVSLSPPGGSYDPGTSVTLTASANSGYTFDHWSGDASGTSVTVSITMNSDKSVTANFSGEGENVENIETASSLDFKLDYTAPETGTITYRERARNLGTANADLRVDFSMEGTEWTYIISGSQQEGWIGMDGQWMSLSDMGYNFDDVWQDYYGSFENYWSELYGWTGGEHEWSYGDYSWRIYDIQVNPNLPDSVFQPG